MSEETYGQRLRDKGVSLGKGTTPTRSRAVSQGKPHYNAYERGTPTDGRGMPYLDEKGQVIGQKAFAETYRSKFAERDNRRATEHLTKE